MDDKREITEVLRTEMSSANDTIYRQEAIDVLEERLRANGYSNVALVSELNRSIGYLMRLPSAKSEHATCYLDSPCEYQNKNIALPSAEPDIIRCKDCIKRDYCRTTNIWAVPPNDDWYCGDAERREE